MNKKYWIKLGFAILMIAGCVESQPRYAPLAVPAGANATVAEYNQKGVQLFHEGRFYSAKQHFEQAVAIDPNMAQVHYNLGLALYQLGNPVAARKHFVDAANLAPGDSVIWNSPAFAPYKDVEREAKPGEKPNDRGSGHGGHSH